MHPSPTKHLMHDAAVPSVWRRVLVCGALALISACGTADSTTGTRSDPPTPPPGSGAHRYYFTIYALDTTLGLAADAGRPEVEAAMAGHVLASAQLMGRYER